MEPCGIVALGQHVLLAHLVDKAEGECFLRQHPPLLLHQLQGSLHIEFALRVLGVLLCDDEVYCFVALLLTLQLLDQRVKLVGVHHAPGVNVAAALVDEVGTVVVDDDLVAPIAEPCGSTGHETDDVGSHVAALHQHVADADGLHHVASERVYLQHHRLALRHLPQVVFEQIAGISPTVYLAL